jgi:hypothetical protein
MPYFYDAGPLYFFKNITGSSLVAARPQQWQRQRGCGNGSSSLAAEAAAWLQRAAWQQWRQFGDSAAAAAAAWRQHCCGGGSDSAAAAAAVLQCRAAWQRQWQLGSSN